MKEEEAQLFWSRVEDGCITDCWPWIGGPLQKKGYGQMQFQARNQTAHNIAYQLSYDDYDASKQVDHTCHQRNCCNPYHLRLATNKQNQENRSGLNRNNTSGFRGVKRQRNKWAARVIHNRKYIHIGIFNTAEEAGKAAEAKRRELFTHD